MKTRRYLLLLAMCAAAWPGRAAELSSAKGSVEIRKSGAPGWRQAKGKEAVAGGDVIRTGAGAAAELKTDEGHKVAMRERSTARVEAAAKGDTRFFLEAGKLRAKVAKLRRGERFEVRTPLAVASVRGTEFEVGVGEDQTSHLTVFEGAVHYKELAGLGRESVVPAGQELIYTPPAAPVPPVPAPAEPKKEGDRTRRLDEKEKEKEDRRRASKEKEALSDKQRALEKERTAEAEKDERPAVEEKVVAPTTGETQLVRLPYAGDYTTTLKEEIMRETYVSLEREYTQTEVAQDLRTETYQDGRSLIDAYGRRVRFEDYVLRPAENRFAYLSMTEREGRMDTLRYDVTAAAPLPKDLSTVNLFEGDLSKNWATSTHLLADNGGDFYREWREGGRRVPFNDGKDRVVFDDWYVEAGGLKGFTLLSHWRPVSGYGGGNLDATLDRDLSELMSDGAADAPFGYQNYVQGGSGAVGDDRDGFNNVARSYSLKDREALFHKGDNTLAGAYAASEGYDRESVALINGRPARFDNYVERAKALASASFFTVHSDYLDTRGAPFTAMDVTRVLVTDDGSVVPREKGAPGGILADGVNLETVYSSKDLFLSRGDIDTIMTSAASRVGVKDDE